MANSCTKIVYLKCGARKRFREEVLIEVPTKIGIAEHTLQALEHLLVVALFQGTV